MAKYFGIKTKSGRMGGSVFAMRGGECIERQYNPYVLNPKSELQGVQRAKMKLASQLSAVLGKNELVGFPKAGTVSSRNMFVKDLFNRDVVQFSNGTATIALNNIRLTASVVDFVRQVNATRDGQSITITGSLLPAYVGKAVGVRYVALFSRFVEGKYTVAIQNAGNLTVASNGDITGTISSAGNNGLTILVYAYMPTDVQVLDKFSSMVTDIDVTAATLNEIRTGSPSSMSYSATLSLVVATA